MAADSTKEKFSDSCKEKGKAVSPQAAQAHYLWVRASEVIWWEYTRIISVLSDAK